MEQVDIRLSPGMMNVICGPNGCGKSTLASLLVKDYLPLEGRISIGGIDIAGLESSFLRKNVLVLRGSDSLWVGTLLDNVCCFAEETDRSISRAVEAMESVGLGELIRRLPQNILSKVGGFGGASLSNGERQKLLMARALFADPQILLLDEATDALDKDSREKIIDLLRERCRCGKTVVLISHDDSMLRRGDRVIYLKTDDICANE